MMEMWDIYDADKKRTGRTMKKNDWCLKDGEYHLTVLGVVAHQDTGPVSGGAAQAGEDSETAVLREIREETGLDVSGWDGGYLFSYRRENPGEGDNYFVDIYRFAADFDEKDIRLQEEETDGYLLATLDEIRAFAAQGIFLHYDSIKEAFEMERK